MPETTGEWRDGGSGGPGHIQQVVVTPEARAGEAWRTYVHHTVTCDTCVQGTDCEDGAGLKAAWRGTGNPQGG